jgi:hypothetical protein
MLKLRVKVRVRREIILPDPTLFSPPVVELLPR